MPLDATGILAAVQSHAMASGLFESVNGHEPKNAPANGLSAAIWVESIGPARSSGLASTSGRIILNVRIYTNMIQEPQDMIDPSMVSAVDTLLAAYSGNFSLSGKIKNVDLLGAAGASLSVTAGYINQDGKLFRVMTISLPLIINDLWTQAP